MQQLARLSEGKSSTLKDLLDRWWDGTLRIESERRKATQLLSIDQVRGHLTPDLLGHTQR